MSSQKKQNVNGSKANARPRGILSNVNNTIITYHLLMLCDSQEDPRISELFEFMMAKVSFHSLVRRQFFLQFMLCIRMIICVFMIPCWMCFFFNDEHTHTRLRYLFELPVRCCCFFVVVASFRLRSMKLSPLPLHECKCIAKTFIYSKRPNWIHTYALMWFQTWQVRVQQDMSLSQILSIFFSFISFLRCYIRSTYDFFRSARFCFIFLRLFFYG